MNKKPQPNPLAITTRAVREGESYSQEVEGGFAQRPAPSDGLLIETVERSHFVSAEELVDRLSDIGYLCHRITADVTTRSVPMPQGPLRLGRVRVTKAPVK